MLGGHTDHGRLRDWSGDSAGRCPRTQRALSGHPGQMKMSLSPALIAGVLIVPILALTSCSIVTTPGSTRTESRAVSGFSKVELAGSGDVTIDQTGKESLTIEAGDKVLPNLTSDVVGDTLVLGTKRGAVLARAAGSNIT